MAAQVQIEAIQTVTPAKAAEPRQTRRVSGNSNAPPDPDLERDLLRAHVRLVAYYKKNKAATGGDVSMHSMGGWFKESLNATLGELPLFAGRLRRAEGGQLEVKLTDSGLRLVQARAEVGMEEFLGARKGSEGKEDALAYWEDIDEGEPQFSALCYVQVTDFKCGGGYSIGLSCSVLLADPAMLTGFLKRWAKVHTGMLSHSRFSKMPIFHLARFRRPGAGALSPHNPSAHSCCHTHTLLFSTRRTPAAAALALCLDEAAGGWRASAGFCSVVHGEERVVLGCHERKKEEEEPSRSLSMGQLADCEIVTASGWDVLGAGEATFEDGNAPVHVSYHVFFGRGAVIVALLSGEDELGFISATVPV